MVIQNRQLVLSACECAIDILIDNFCKMYHDNMGYRREIRRQAVDRAESQGDGPIVPINEFDRVFYLRPFPRTVAELNYGLVSGSSSSLSRSSLSTLPAEEGGVTLRSHFSVMGSEAGNSKTVDGDSSSPETKELNDNIRREK